MDGVTFEFIDAAGSEAPAEFMFYLPEFKALCSSEVASGTLHNVLTQRGAKARDTLKLESRFDPQVVAKLRAWGHEVETIGAWDEAVGHAGMLIRHPNGVLEGGYDPRSDGAVAGY